MNKTIGSFMIINCNSRVLFSLILICVNKTLWILQQQCSQNTMFRDDADFPEAWAHDLPPAPLGHFQQPHPPSCCIRPGGNSSMLQPPKLARFLGAGCISTMPPSHLKHMQGWLSAAAADVFDSSWNDSKKKGTEEIKPVVLLQNVSRTLKQQIWVWQWIMSRKKRSLSISPMSARCLVAITFVFDFSPLMPAAETHPCEHGGVLTVRAPALPLAAMQNGTSLKPDAALFPPLTQHSSLKKTEEAWARVCESARDNQHQSQMPAYATNMRLKFPILALTLEIITIILFALFAVYDDGKHSGHSPSSNHTQEVGPMDLYPSKSTWRCLLDVLTADGLF